MMPDWKKIRQEIIDGYASLGKTGRPARNFVRAWMQTHYGIFKLPGTFYRLICGKSQTGSDL